MNKMLQNSFVLLIALVVVVTAEQKLNKLPKSHLILEYNWPEPRKNLRRIPHSQSCNHFYLTKPDGKHVLKKCFGDDIFDYRVLQCVEKTSAKCWKDIVKKGNIKKVKSQFLCPYHWGLYPDPEDCSQFYDCLSGKPYPRKCPADTFFDKTERTCLPSDKAKCAGVVLSSLVVGNIKKVKRQFLCPYHWGLYPDPEDCSQFYDCLSGKPYPRKCPADTLFDKTERTCLPSDKAKCAGVVVGNMKDVKRHFFCRYHSGLYPDDEDCSQFYDCFKGKPYSRKCPAHTLFDKVKRICLPSSEAKCSEGPDITKIDNVLSETTPLTKIVKLFPITSNDDSNIRTTSGVDLDESSLKEDTSKDVKTPSKNAKSTPILKIISPDHNGMITHKDDVLTSDNSKFTIPHTDSDENSSKDESERYSPSSEVESSTAKILTVRITDGRVTRNEKATSFGLTEMVHESPTARNDEFERLQTAVSSAETSLTPENKKIPIGEVTVSKNSSPPPTANQNFKTEKRSSLITSTSEKSTFDTEANSKTFNSSPKTYDVTESVFKHFSPTTDQNEKTEKRSIYTTSTSENSTFERKPKIKNFSLLPKTSDITESVTDVACPKTNGHFSHPNDRHKYIVCTDGYPLVMKCPEKLFYDAIRKLCDHDKV